MTKPHDTKAGHKTSAAAANDKGAYEDTAFGKRRISKMPKALAMLVGVAAVPVLFIYRRLRRSRDA